MLKWRSTICSAALALCCILVSSSNAMAQKIAPEQAQKQRVEIAFVLDTTGSMSGLIDGAKKKIWSIANTIIDQHPDAEIKIGLVGYRDIGDEYVVKHFPLTTDVQSIYAHLLEFKADGGGDTPESVNEALDDAVTKLGWSPVSENVDRILFLVGDAPPHMDYKQDRKYPEVLKEAAQKKIIVNTVLAGNSQETKKVWQKIAKLGNGEFHAIPQDGGQVVVIVTPYDEEIRTIQIELNKTVIPYGSVAQQADVDKKSKMYASAPAASAAEMTKYVSKGSKGKAVVTGKGDLVKDMAEERIDLATLPEKDLPKDMQPMKPEERKKYIAEQSAKREELSKKLAEKVKLRDEYILNEQAKAPAPKAADSFDASVVKSLEKQVKKK